MPAPCIEKFITNVLIKQNKSGPIYVKKLMEYFYNYHTDSAVMEHLNSIPKDYNLFPKYPELDRWFRDFIYL